MVLVGGKFRDTMAKSKATGTTSLCYPPLRQPCLGTICHRKKDSDMKKLALTVVWLCHVSNCFAAEPSRYQPPESIDSDVMSRRQLVEFIRELADKVYDKHVVRDEKRRTFGMTYEYLNDGQKMQDFGLDSMHDGAWFMSAMVTAHRVDPPGGHLERALKYQVPFYVNILQNSDRLFPKMKPREGQEQFTQPVKGWIPRGWDDGLGIDLDGRSFATTAFYDGMTHPDKKVSTSLHFDGNRVEHAYFTSSHHLLQDLADGLMNVWLTTRDPQVANAIMQIHQGRIEYGRQIPVVRVAAGITNGKDELFQRPAPEPFVPDAMRPFYAGAYLLKPERVVAYNDGAAWSYRDECARAAVASESIDVEAAYQIAGSAYGLMAGMEAFYPNGEYRYGDWLFDLGGNQNFFTEGTGQLGRYAEDGEPRLGTRGIQVSAYAAAVLPAVVANPDVWERRYREDFAADTLVRIVDEAPKVDGLAEQIYENQQAMSAGSTKVSLVSDPRNLNLFVESDSPVVTIRVSSLATNDDSETSGVITVTSDKAVAKNSVGEALVIAAAFKTGDLWSTELRIPYSIVNGQPQWMNGVDHGRYEIQINDAKPQSIYMLSSHKRLVSRLESMAMGTIAQWHGYWQKHKSIPSGYYRSGRPFRWNYGDAGNYGHLIKCISFWLMHRDETSEWKLITEQVPTTPISVRPLPDSVLEVQGLK